ncbi:hypothetical protein AT6N2_C1934 [Agrobacterium tumefaciens]|nr:hypothetical protein AT6N2_C1934 [Agrobacterium tumefaciens]
MVFFIHRYVGDAFAFSLPKRILVCLLRNADTAISGNRVGKLFGHHALPDFAGVTLAVNLFAVFRQHVGDEGLENRGLIFAICFGDFGARGTNIGIAETSLRGGAIQHIDGGTKALARIGEAGRGKRRLVRLQFFLGDLYFQRVRRANHIHHQIAYNRYRHVPNSRADERADAKRRVHSIKKHRGQCVQERRDATTGRL